MQESFPLAVDWNALTDEERYELEIRMSEAYEWNEAHGWYDKYPDEYGPDEYEPDKTWTEYLIEQEKFKWNATSFYKKYLEYKGEKEPSPMLLSIFRHNTELLNFFINRIIERNLKGCRISREFQAIMELQNGKPQKIVDDSKKLEPLRSALSELGFDTKSKSVWFGGFANKNGIRRRKHVFEIMKEYRFFIERNQ